MLKLPSPNVAAETHTVYLSYKGVYAPAVLPGNSLFKHTSWLSKKLSCTKILLMVRMRPTAIALNYSIENIWNDVRQKIYEKFQFDSLVWGSLTLAPIKAQFDNCLSSSLLMPAKKTLWQQLRFVVCWLSLFLVQQNNTSTWSKCFVLPHDALVTYHKTWVNSWQVDLMACWSGGNWSYDTELNYETSMKVEVVELFVRPFPPLPPFLTPSTRKGLGTKLNYYQVNKSCT